MDNDYGMYGVLRFLKKDDDTAVVANYPIDEEELTFGREQDSNIRLYYPTVSHKHARIVFQDRKAFLIVLGLHGLLADGCAIYPSTSSGQTTVPLINNTILEISKKRFRFQYPPKPIRAALLAQINTPTASPSSRSRTLRLSMIQSAQVFSPGPDPDPRVNLRILKTPLRRSPLKRDHDVPDEEEPPIVLVDGNHPRVVEEDKDLVILEDVALSKEIPQQQYPLKPLVSRRPQQFSTPLRRPPRNSLHRAVLIRSAQRVVQRETKRQEEEDMELDAVEMIVEEPSAAPELGDDRVAQDGSLGHDLPADTDREEEEEAERGRSEISTWRRGIDAVRTGWRAISRSVSPEKEPPPLSTSGSTKEEEEGKEESVGLDQIIKDEDIDDQHSGQDSLAPVHTPRSASSVRLPPQRPTADAASPFRPAQGVHSNLSLADRVKGTSRLSSGRHGIATSSQLRTLEPWKVSEIEVQRQRSPECHAALPSPRISATERQAIQERRRSALVTTDSFWTEAGIPGSRRSSPTKIALAPSHSGPARLAAPDFGASSPERLVTAPSYASAHKPSEDAISVRSAKETVRDQHDTIVEASEEPDLLDHLRSTIETMQRRRSMRAEDEDRQKAVIIMHAELEDDEADVQNTLALSRNERPITPPMGDLRHVFAPPRGTPRMSGVQDMFAIENEEANGEFYQEQGLETALPTGRKSPDEVPTSDDEEARCAVDASASRSMLTKPPPEHKPSPIPRIARAMKTAAASGALSRPRAPIRSGRATPASARTDDDDEEEVPVPRLKTRSDMAVKPALGSKDSARRPTGASASSGHATKAKTAESTRRVRKRTGEDDDDNLALPKPPTGKKLPVRATRSAVSGAARPPSASSRHKGTARNDDRDPLAISTDDEDNATVATRVRRRHAADDENDDKATRTRKTPSRTSTRKPATTSSTSRKMLGRSTTASETGGKENTPDSIKAEDDDQPAPAPSRSKGTVAARSGMRRAAVRKDAAGQSEPESGMQAKTRTTRSRAATRG